MADSSEAGDLQQVIGNRAEPQSKGNINASLRENISGDIKGIRLEPERIRKKGELL